MRTTNSETAELLFDIIVWLTWNRQKQHEGPGMDPPAIYTNNTCSSNQIAVVP